jgi:hypothetical protein
MAIEIDRLNELLLQMADQNAPGREFSAAIAELARTGRFAQLRDVLPPVVYDELWNRYQSNPSPSLKGGSTLPTRCNRVSSSTPASV